MPLTLRLHAGEYAVCRLEPTAGMPSWAAAPGFCSVTRTADELSIICAATSVPADVKQEAGWRLVQLVGPFSFEAIGVLTSILEPIAKAGISTLAIATFDTDYLLIKTYAIPESVSLLEQHGHTFLRTEE